MTKALRRLIELADDVIVYVCTVAGILCSNAIPLLKANDAFKLDLSPWRLGVAAFIAFTIIGRQERLTPDKEGKTASARAGRRARLIPRMQNAAANGFMWSQIMNIGK